MTKTQMRLLGICLLLSGLYLMNVGSQQMADREARLAERAATPCCLRGTTSKTGTHTRTLTARAL